MLCCFKRAMLLEDEEPLGPLLGKFPPELLRLVLAHLTPFERALFARASGSCFRACEESGLGRAGVRRGDRRQVVKKKEMVASRSMYEWTRREAGLNEERFYTQARKRWHTDKPQSLMNQAAETAAIIGDLEYFKCVLLTLRSSEYGSYEHEDQWKSMNRAAEHGHRHLIEWGLANGLHASSLVCAYAAKSGRLKMLKWLRVKGCPWDETTCRGAAEGGHLEILRWARDNGCPWDEETCRGAAEEGHFGILRWARGNGCPWDETTCIYAAEGGHFEILRWARGNGCPWDETTCRGAAEGGHFGILRWARDNGCPWDETTCEAAAEGGHLEILRWARDSGCPCPEQHLDV